MDSSVRTFRYKMILFGDESVGKTSLVERFINDKFEESYISTLGYNLYQKQINYENCIIYLMIFDIGGQEKFRKLRSKYAEGTDTAFLIYDVTNQKSFDNIYKWRKDLKEFAGDVPFIIIGNKNDLKGEYQVPKERALEVAYELGALDFFETSAKTGAGVEDAFTQLAIETFKSYSSG